MSELFADAKPSLKTVPKNKFKGQHAIMSSLTDEWRTPTSLYEQLNREFQFNFDPCPSSNEFRDFDGLGEWKERNFINPPYSQVRQWVEHAYKQSLKGKLCVLLTASRTDTRWFHDFVLPYAKEIRFLKGRLNFNDSGKPAPFPSVIIIFDGRNCEVSV